MSSKRKFCDHCKEFVTLRTYRLHAHLYSIRASEAVYSSEEEEISRDDSEDFHVEHLASGEAWAQQRLSMVEETRQHFQVQRDFFTFWGSVGVSVISRHFIRLYLL